MQAARYFVRPVGFLESQWRARGDLFTIKFPFFEKLVYVVDPEAIRDIFTGDPTRFHAGEGNAGPLGPVLGDYSLLTLDGEAHMEQRKLLLPPFHGERIERYREVMAAAAERELDRWPVGRAFPLRPSMQRATLEVILRAVFGVREEERLERFRRLIPRFSAASTMVILLPGLRRDLGRFSPWRRFLRVRRDLDDLVYEEIRLRRGEASAEERDDVLSLLLAARHEDGSPMSDLELRDELVTVLGAGHETSATALAWAFERILRHPNVEQRLRESIAARDGEYVDAVVKETLRVRPVVVDVVRKLTADTEIAGRLLPAGTYVVPPVALVHLRPDAYPDPHAFRPERFLEGQPEPYTWIPFGGGVRRCIGASFAQLEIRTMLETLIPRVRMRAASPRPERQRADHVTIVPWRGTRVVVEERLQLLR